MPFPGLPDIYETRQGHALREALDRGDTAEARRLIDHVLAESPTSPAEREYLSDVMAAALLFRMQTEATEAGQHEHARLLADLATATCSSDAITTVLAGAYLQTGLHEGLPARVHDQLMQWLNAREFSNEMRQLAAGIRRHPDNDTEEPRP